MSRQDYTEQHSMPPWCETHDGPRGGKGAENCSVCFDEQHHPLSTRLRALADDMDELDRIVHEQYGYLMLEDGLTDSIRNFAAELEKER